MTDSPASASSAFPKTTPLPELVTVQTIISSLKIHFNGLNVNRYALHHGSVD